MWSRASACRVEKLVAFEFVLILALLNLKIDTNQFNVSTIQSSSYVELSSLLRIQLSVQAWKPSNLRICFSESLNKQQLSQTTIKTA